MNGENFTNYFSDQQFFNFFGTERSTTPIECVSPIEIQQTHIHKITVLGKKGLIAVYFEDNLGKKHPLVKIDDMFVGFFFYNKDFLERYSIILNFEDELVAVPLKLESFVGLGLEIRSVFYALVDLSYSKLADETINADLVETELELDKNKHMDTNSHFNSSTISEYYTNKTVFLGHRGSGPSDKTINYIENTEQAFDTAITNGASWIEIDVQLTLDQIPIIHHNHYITYKNKKVAINSLEFSQLTEIHNSYHPNSHHKLITLKDMLLKYQNTNFNVEIKYPMSSDIVDFEYKYTDPLVYTKKIVDVVDKYNNGSRIIYSCFNPQILISLRIFQVKHPIFFLLHEIDERNDVVQCRSILDASIFCKQIFATGIVLYDKFLDGGCENLIGFLHGCNLKVFAYGEQLIEIDKVTEYVKNGLDGVITDKIDIVNEKSVIKK